MRAWCAYGGQVEAALGVAVGAGFFMLSDALLATNRFAHPLPMAQLWVLSSYYVAQILIVFNARPVTQPPLTPAR